MTLFEFLTEAISKSSMTSDPGQTNGIISSLMALWIAMAVVSAMCCLACAASFCYWCFRPYEHVLEVRPQATYFTSAAPPSSYQAVAI